MLPSVVPIWKARIRALSLFSIALLAIPSLATAQGTPFTLRAGDVVAPSGGTALVPVDLDATLESQGISFSICNDPALAEPIEAVPGSGVATINNGLPPDFIATQFSSSACSVSIVYSLTGTGPALAAGNDLEIAVIQYEVVVGLASGTIADLTLCTASTPPIEVIVVNNGNSFVPDTIAGSIEVGGTLSTIEFIRGDTNGDGTVSVTDAIVLLGNLFGIVPDGDCPRSGDVNLTGDRDLSDAIVLLDSIVGGGPPVPPPYPNCGVSAVTSLLPCQPSTACP